ncbi:MAG: hypothetical protein KA204_00165 [Chromatiaceae bacterium]|nr:hypothetical protein [Chromatiaceae bacterium]MBP8282936.1 hypothetical protein [Chromatiaceae bacterium]
MSDIKIDFDTLIEKYIKIRDTKAQIAEKQKAEMARFNNALTQIERLLLDEFNVSGAESVRTKHGTAYRTVQTSVSVSDRDLFMNFVREGDNWIFLDAHANKSAVKQYLESEQQLPPGVNVVSRATVNVQR